MSDRDGRQTRTSYPSVVDNLDTPARQTPKSVILTLPKELTRRVTDKSGKESHIGRLPSNLVLHVPNSNGSVEAIDLSRGIVQTRFANPSKIKDSSLGRLGDQLVDLSLSKNGRIVVMIPARNEEGRIISKGGKTAISRKVMVSPIDLANAVKPHVAQYVRRTAARGANAEGGHEKEAGIETSTEHEMTEKVASKAVEKASERVPVEGKERNDKPDERLREAEARIAELEAQLRAERVRAAELENRLAAVTKELKDAQLGVVVPSAKKAPLMRANLNMNAGKVQKVADRRILDVKVMLDKGMTDTAKKVLNSIVADEEVEKVGIGLPSGIEQEGHGERPSTPGEMLPRNNRVAEYESCGVLPVFDELRCSADVNSPTSTVPEGFTHVAYRPDRCVSAEYFNELLGRARMQAENMAGMDEVTIERVARSLARASFSDRDFTVINGVLPVDFTGKSQAIPGGAKRSETVGERTIVDKGSFAVAYDPSAIARELASNGVNGISPGAVSEMTRMLSQELEASYNVLVGAIRAKSVNDLLRSSEAVEALLDSGIRLENKMTGEGLDRPDEGPLVRKTQDGAVVDFVPCANISDPLYPEYVHICNQVAATEGWSVHAEDVDKICGGDSAARVVLENARMAYLHDKGIGINGGLPRLVGDGVHEATRVSEANCAVGMEGRLKVAVGKGYSVQGAVTQAGDAIVGLAQEQAVTKDAERSRGLSGGRNTQVEAA